MSNAVMLIQHYDGMCEKIRELTDSTDVVKSGELSDKVTEVYENGKQKERSDFWDAYYEENYGFAGRGWNKNSFKPNRDVNVGGYCFNEHNRALTPYDLAEHLDSLGVKLKYTDTMNSCFRGAWLSRIPVVDFSKNSPGNTMTYTFFSSKIVTIDKIILPPEGYMRQISSAFDGCTQLENIIFEGVIDKSINFAACPLSKESMKNISSCLKNFTGTGEEYTYTVTFKATAFETLEEEGATSPNGNTWAEYIDDLKWNLVKG